MPRCGACRRQSRILVSRLTAVGMCRALGIQISDEAFIRGAAAARHWEARACAGSRMGRAVRRIYSGSSLSPVELIGSSGVRCVERRCWLSSSRAAPRVACDATTGHVCWEAGGGDGAATVASGAPEMRRLRCTVASGGLSRTEEFGWAGTPSEHADRARSSTPARARGVAVGRQRQPSAGRPSVPCRWDVGHAVGPRRGCARNSRILVGAGCGNGCVGVTGISRGPSALKAVHVVG